MDLNFELQGGYFISEFEVTSDFNLHIEKDPIGEFLVYQRTAGGQYDLIQNFKKDKGNDSIIDYDFQALVYPKWIKIKSSVKPIVAAITTDGEINEVVYQAKNIEITSNGTTKITADTGYTALSSVNVKVNVPTEGGGDIMEYLLVEELPNELWELVSGFASFYKVYYNSTGTWAIYPANAFSVSEIKSNSLYAICLDFQSEYIGPEPFNGKLIDMFIKMGLKERLDTVPRITKEEFYSLELLPN